MDLREDGETLKPNFESLPNELFLIIFSYMDSVFVQDCLKKVCTRFYNIISDEYFWKNKLNKQYPDARLLSSLNNSSNNNISDVQDEYDGGKEICDFKWSSAAYEIEKDKNFFKDCQNISSSDNSSVEVTVLRDIHIGVVHELKLVANNNLCVSASRDRTLAIWNVADTTSTQPLKHISAHEGWVWCLDSCSTDAFYSGAWDASVKKWCLETFTNISTFKCNAAVISMSCSDDLVAVGQFNSKLSLFDSRLNSDKEGAAQEYIFERKGVIQGLALDGNLIYSVSSIGLLNIYDLRKKDVIYQSNKSVCERKAEVMSFSYNDGTVIVGDTKNCLNILNKDLTVLASRKLISEDPKNRKISCLKQNGSDFICGTGSCLLLGLKSKPIVTLGSFKTMNDIVELTSVEYISDNMLIYSSGIAGEVFLLKRSSTY